MMNPVFDEALDDKPWSTRERAHTNTHKHERTYTQAQSTRRHGHGSNHEHERARTAHPRTHTARHTRTSRAHTHTQQAHRRRPTRARAPSGPCPVPPRTTGIEQVETPLPANPPRPTRLKAPSTPLFGLRRMGMTPGTWHAGYGARGAIELACAAGGVLQRAAPEAHLGPSRDKIAILGKISFYATLKSHKRTSTPGDGHNVTKNMFQWI